VSGKENVTWEGGVSLGGGRVFGRGAGSFLENGGAGGLGGGPASRGGLSGQGIRGQKCRL
jgi:hypothetical protein